MVGGKAVAVGAKKVGGAILAALLVLFLATPAGAAGKLPAAVARALKQANIPAEHVGIFVQDVVQARPLLARGEQRAMNPASTMKLLTTYAALEVLGPAYSWKTEIFGTGALQNEVLAGDLILKGYGDPALTLENFWLLLRDLRSRGVREIRGDLVLDQHYFNAGNGDSGAFDSNPYRPYNAGPEALLLNFKVLHFRLTPEAEGVRLLVDPALPGLRLVNKVRAVPGACGEWRDGIAAGVEPDGQAATLTLSGDFPAACGEKDLSLSVLDNGRYVLGVFRQLWQELGGTLHGGVRQGEVPPDARLLASHESKPVAEVVRDINKFSNNVMARQVFLTLGAQFSGEPGSPANAAQAVKAWLAGKELDFPELVLENGSGLSRIERISPRHLGELLLAAFRGPLFSELESSLPLVAADGTMRKRLNGKSVAGHAHIKTGSLEGVRAIAGYVLGKRGRRVVVVCIINHANAGAGQAAQDALLEWVYQRS